MTQLSQLMHEADRCCQRGQPEQAIDVYRQVLELDNAPPEVNLRLGQLYEEQGCTEEAARCFRIVADSFRHGPVKLAALRQLAALEPGCPEHHLRLAEVYQHSGQPRQAFQAYSKAAELMVFADRQDSAVLVLEKLSRLMPTNHALQQELRRLRGEPATLLDIPTVVEFRPARPTRPGRPVLLPSVEGDPAPPLAASHAKK